MMFTILVWGLVACYNVPPGPVNPVILPEFPSTDDDLTAKLETEAADYNGDELTYEFQWFQNGDESDVDGDTVESDQTERGDVWYVKVSATDGKSEGPWIESAPVEIQ